MRIVTWCFWFSFMAVWAWSCGEEKSDSDDDADTSMENGTETGGDTGSDSATEAPFLNAICKELDGTWSADWSAFEDEFLALLNDERAAGADCGAEGTYAAASPLTMDEALRCAARAHSLYMGEEGTFSHESPDGPLGESFTERAANAGYTGMVISEEILSGQTNPDAAVSMIMTSEIDCANVMTPIVDEAGVAYVEVDGSPFQRYLTLMMGQGY